jgi:hypothetical protein
MNAFIKSILFLVLIPDAAFAGMKSLGGSMHGDRMIVDYEVLNTGKHVLTVKDKNADKEAQPKQVVDLKIKENGEQLALGFGSGFFCENDKSEFVYGVFKKADARESGSWTPLRAWSIDKGNIKLMPINDTRQIKCQWSQEGESEFPFKGAANEPPAPPSSKANLYYFELYPNTPKKYRFQTSEAKAHCKQDKLHVESFSSHKPMKSSDTGKNENVEVINLYVSKLLTGCIQEPGRQSQKLMETFAIPVKKMFRHVYVTTDEDISVVSE